MLQLGNDSHTYNSGISTAGKVDKKKQKRFRSAFTTMQIAILEKEFKKDPYVTNIRREEVANSLNIPERAVKIWFQNRRMKEKRDSCKGYDREDSDANLIGNLPDGMVNKISPANQQAAPTSLAAKIVVSDDTVEVTKNENYKVTTRVDKPYMQVQENITEVHSVKERVKEASTSNAPMEKHGSYCISSKTNGTLSIDKPTPFKQTVGHVLPFSQVSKEPHKATHTTPRTDHAHQNGQSDTKAPDLIPPYSSVPVDLSKYYSSMSPVPHLPWNRNYFVPIMPGTQGLPYFGGPQGVATAPAHIGVATVKKCSCDCHSSPVETMRAQHPMFYTPYVPHFITPVPTSTPHPTTKY